ncbi:MAG TPA: hypothetical protein PKW61_02140 [Tenuifilaceae bacterium]|nr:hypothetical protein [Tenuifilaceae bacterium]
MYIFVLNGKVSVDGIELDSRDGLGILDIRQLSIKSISSSEILLMEVPMS